MNIYLTKKQQETLKAILKYEQSNQYCGWEVDGTRDWEIVEIILMKLNGGK